MAVAWQHGGQWYSVRINTLVLNSYQSGTNSKPCQAHQDWRGNPEGKDQGNIAGLPRGISGPPRYLRLILMCGIICDIALGFLSLRKMLLLVSNISNPAGDQRTFHNPQGQSSVYRMFLFCYPSVHRGIINPCTDYQCTEDYHLCADDYRSVYRLFPEDTPPTRVQGGTGGCLRGMNRPLRFPHRNSGLDFIPCNPLISLAWPLNILLR